MSALRLRSLSIADEVWIHRACQDPEIQRWTQVPRPYSREHARQFLESTDLEFRRWAVEEPGVVEGLGLVSIHGVDQVTGDADIGYWVAPWARGHRVGTRAVQALIDEVGAEATVKRLLAAIAAENLASQRVVRGAGFIEIGSQMGPAVDHLQPVPTRLFAYVFDR